jgi:hypothetical protein
MFPLVLKTGKDESSLDTSVLNTFQPIGSCAGVISFHRCRNHLTILSKNLRPYNGPLSLFIDVGQLCHNPPGGIYRTKPSYSGWQWEM